MTRPTLGRALVALVALLALGAPAAAFAPTAAASPPLASVPLPVPLSPEPGTFWFGPQLDWEVDSAQTYSRRLGADASLFGRSIGYPLTPTSETLLRDVSRQSAAEGAVAVVTLEPADLVALTPEDATDFADAAAAVAAADGSFLLVRFAPEMNGSWAPWGRRPLTYVSMFRDLADAVHARTDRAALVWSPAYGAGYPFDAPVDASITTAGSAPDFDRRNIPFLDTDGDGAVSGADDPYGPYYPGDDYVDWVGLTMLRYADRGRAGSNRVPRTGEVETRFDETFGYDDDSSRSQDSFYARFAERTGLPFLLTTAATYNPSRKGASELEIKQGWLLQVVGAAASRPLVQAVQWLEQARADPEVGGTVRWQLAGDPALASVSRAVLEQGAVTFAPLDGIGPEGDGAPEAGGPVGATNGNGSPDEGGFPPFLGGVLVTLAAVLVAGVAAVQVRRRRMVPPWLR